MSAATSKSKTGKKSRLFFIAILFIAACFLVYPSFTDELTNMRQTMSIGGYSKEVSELSETEISEIKKNAIDYNKKIYEQQQYAPFTYEGEEYEDEEYDRMLKFSDISSVMAYVDIPELGIYVPVVHGTKADDLNYQAGHMHGTSLPVGGENTHCVIAGHTGLTSSDLFDNLEEMEVGDEVRIRVLNETHIYTVIEINVVLPQYTDRYLQIEKDADLLTLFTCTPYGINSHRLLIKCERSGTVIDGNQQGTLAKINGKNVKALIMAVLFGLIPFATSFAAWYLLIKSPEIQKKKKADNKAAAVIKEEQKP